MRFIAENSFVSFVQFTTEKRFFYIDKVDHIYSAHIIPVIHGQFSPLSLVKPLNAHVDRVSENRKCYLSVFFQLHFYMILGDFE